jgi:prophage regulatory protein
VVKYIRLKQLASTAKSQGMLPIAPVTIWRWVKSNKFPKPIKLGPQVVVWELAEIEAFINNKRNKK